jgi:hypothetical protein
MTEDFQDLGPLHYNAPREERIEPLLREKLSALALDYYNQTGEPLNVTDTFRTSEEQASAHARKPKLALPAGTSRHEQGSAFDVDQGQIAKIGVTAWQEMLGKHGLTLPALSKGETWHVELNRSGEKAEKVAAKVPDFKDLGPVESDDFKDLGPVEVAPKAEAPITAPEQPIIDAGLPEATFSQVPDPIKSAIGGATATGLKAGAAIIGAPHEYFTKPVIEKPLDYLLQKAGVPATQETPMEAMLTPGEFGQVGGAPIEGTIQVPLRDLAVTGAGLVGDLPVYGGLAKLGRALSPGRKLHELAPEAEVMGPSLESQLKEGVIQAYADKSYPPFPLSEKLTPLATEKYVSALNRENEAIIATSPTQWSREKGKFMYGGGPSTEEIKAFAQNALEEGAPLLTVVGQVANKFKISPEAAYSALRGGIGGGGGKGVAPPMGVVGGVPKSPLDLGEPIKDIDARTLGSFSTETKPYLFDRVDRVLPGAKDSIYWPHKMNEKRGLEEVHLLEGQSRELEKVLPRGSSEAIMLNAIARQKGGPEILKAMGVGDLPKLMPEQEAALGQLRNVFDDLFTRFNEARIAAGKKPIDKVENYFTFFRRLDEARKENLNILTESKDFFNPRVSDLDFAKKRSKSDLALVTDAFKVFRNYARGVVPWIHQAPHLKEVSDLSRSLLETHPNLSYALGRWVNNIQGIDIPRQLGALDRPLRKLTNNVSVSVLGGYTRSALAQPASLIGTAGEVGPRYLIQGIVESIVPSRVRFALENSAVLKTREFDISVVDAMERMIGDTLAGRIKRGATAASYIPLRAMDAQAARATWLGAYKRASNRGFDDPIKYADEVVLKTQGSAASSDISDIQTHAIGKFLTQFQTFVINDFNYIARDLLGIKNPDITKREQLRKVINYVLAGTLVNSVADEIGIPTPIPSPIKAMRSAREEGKEGLDVLKAGGAELAQKLPVIGGAARFGGSLGGPMLNFAERAMRGQESLPIAAGKLLGVPGVNQLQKFLPMMVGDEEPTAENLKAALAGKTQERYESERGRGNLSPEKRFMQGLKEPVDSSLEELLRLID